MSSSEPSKSNPVISLRRIKTLILERSGIYFKEYGMDSLLNSVRARMKVTGCESESKYFDYLTHDDSGAEEMTHLMNLLTINHTLFFRNAEQFTHLRDSILPEIVERKRVRGDSQIRILSASCSTGEEPYSIAMILQGMLSETEIRSVRILATDINTEALSTAKMGRYSVKQLERTRVDFVKRYLKKHCVRGKDYFQIPVEIQRMISFDYMNLTEDAFPEDMDIVFCRNVLIYFDPETIKGVLSKIHSSLAPEGYFFAGGTETLFGISNKFEILDFDDALIYKKVMGESSEVVVKKEKLDFDGQSQSTEFEKNVYDAMSHYKSGKRFYEQHEYERAIFHLKEAIRARPWYLESYLLLCKILMNQNESKEAERIAGEAIKIDKLSPIPYYLLGCIYHRRRSYEGSINFLRRAIFIENNFSLAYFQLGQIYKEMDLPNKAHRSFRHCISALEHDEYFDRMADGISKKSIDEQCQNYLLCLSTTEDDLSSD